MFFQKPAGISRSRKAYRFLSSCLLSGRSFCIPMSASLPGKKFVHTGRRYTVHSSPSFSFSFYSPVRHWDCYILGVASSTVHAPGNNQEGAVSLSLFHQRELGFCHVVMVVAEETADLAEKSIHLKSSFSHDRTFGYSSSDGSLKSQYHPR